MEAKGKRFSRQDTEVEAALIQLARHSDMYGKAQIHRCLVQQFGEERVPTERTVARLVDKAREGDPPQPWHWSEFPPDDARILLEVTDAIIQQSLSSASDPKTGWVMPKVIALRPDHFQTAYIGDKSHANWVIRVAKLAPGLGPLGVYWVSMMYVFHERMGVSPSGIDTFLTMHPWRDMASARSYLSALYDGRISPMTQHGIPLIEAFMDAFELYPPNREHPPVMETEQLRISEEE